MTKAWEFIKSAVESIKSAVNAYVDFVEAWPGAVALLWPVTVVLAIWLL